MAGSAIAVVQMACSKIGIDKPQDFEDGDAGPEAELHYEHVVATVISKHPWRFAMRKVQISQDADEAPVNEWTYAYTLPPTRIGDIVEVRDSAAIGNAPFKDYEIYGGFLYTNATTIFVDYKTRPAEATWPPYFTDIIVHHMASILAQTLCDDEGKSTMLLQLAYGTPQEGGNGGLIQAARRQNAFQEPPRQITSFPLLEARFGGMP